MRCRLGLVVAFLLVSRFGSGGAPEKGIAAAEEIVGTWRGSSVCVDRQAAPACNDEEVIYDISPGAAKPDTVTVKADKVVEGKRANMGALDFSRDKRSGSWISEMETPRLHAVWRIEVKGTTMTGTLTLLPSNAMVRKLDLRKVP